jgi:hypothetical protein
VGNFGTLNAALIVISAMVLLSQGWPTRLRDWVRSKIQ